MAARNVEIVAREVREEIVAREEIVEIAAALPAHEEIAVREAKALHAGSVVGLLGHEVRAARVVPQASGHHVRLVRVARVVPVRREIAVRAPRALIVRHARLLKVQ